MLRGTDGIIPTSISDFPNEFDIGNPLAEKNRQASKKISFVRIIQIDKVRV
jgi:hypothetical protein